LKTLIINAPAELRDTLDLIKGPISLIRHIAALRPGKVTTPTASAKAAMRAIARRWLALDREIQAHVQELERLFSEKAPGLMNSHGISTMTAAEMLIRSVITRSGSNPRQLWPNYAGFAQSLLQAEKPTECA
jgi:transposase